MNDQLLGSERGGEREFSFQGEIGERSWPKGTNRRFGANGWCVVVGEMERDRRRGYCLIHACLHSAFLTYMNALLDTTCSSRVSNGTLSGSMSRTQKDIIFFYRAALTLVIILSVKDEGGDGFIA
jgi:hypothetical protein